MHVFTGTHHSLALPATLSTKFDTGDTVHPDIVDAQLNHQYPSLSILEKKSLTCFKIEKISSESPIKETSLPKAAIFKNPAVSQANIPSASTAAKTEPSLPAAKQTIFYDILTEIMYFHNKHPGQLAIFGSCGVDLLHTHVNENVNDLDILLNDEETANKLIIHLNQKLQSIVFSNTFPWSDCHPNVRFIGNRSDKVGLAPLSGQLTLFHTGKPWIKIECSVKKPWMTELDFTHEHYVNRIHVYIKTQYSGTLPVLSINGYLTLDLISLKKNKSEIIAQTTDNQKLTELLLNSAVALSKIQKHFSSLYLQQQKISAHEFKQLTELNALLHETIGLIKSTYSADLLYQHFFGSPYQLKHSTSHAKRELIEILLTEKSRFSTTYSFHDLTILLKNDFDLKNTEGDGNCFYEALASGLNQNSTAATHFLTTYNFMHSTALTNTPNKRCAISSEMVRSTIHHWIACAHNTALTPSEYQELHALVLPEPGKTIADLLENRTIADPAGNPNDTAHYGWSSLLHILGIITGATIILMRVNAKEQNIEKHKHSIHEANQLTPNLLAALRNKQPTLFNSYAGDTRLSNLLFIAHSGGDHYYAASPSEKLINFFKPYVIAEQYLITPDQPEERQFKQQQYQTNQLPPAHQQTITIETSGNPFRHSDTSPDHIEKEAKSHSSESLVSCVTKKEPPSESTTTEASNPAEDRKTDRETLIKNKNQIVLSMISNPKIYRSLSEDKKKNIGESLFKAVLSIIQEPDQTASTVTIDMRNLSDTALSALETGKRLNHTESILILAFYKIIHHCDNNNPLFITEVLRDLQTVTHAGHPQALVVLSILSALTGSPEAFSLGMQPPDPAHSNQQYHSLLFTLPFEFRAFDQSNQAIFSAQSVRHFIEKTDLSTSDWIQIDRYFPVNEEINASLTPTLLISDTSESGITDVAAMTEAMLHCVYKGNISLHRRDTENALVFFLKSAIAYIMAMENRTVFSHYEEAAGLSAIYLTIHLIPHIDQQCNLQTVAPFLHEWMPHIDFIQHRFETASLKTLLYVIKAQRITETLRTHSWFTYAYTKAATLLGHPLPESFETFKSLLNHEVKFLFDNGKSIPELPTHPAQQNRGTTDTTNLVARNSKEYRLACTADGNKSWSIDPVLMEKYKISQKQETKKQTKKAVNIVSSLKVLVDSLSNEFMQLYKDAAPNKSRDVANFYDRFISLTDQSIELATQDIPIIINQLESYSKDRAKNNFLEKTKIQQAMLTYNTLVGFAALTHIKGEISFKQDLAHRVIQFYNAFLTKESIESIIGKQKQQIDKMMAHFIELLDPSLYNDSSEHFVKSLITILVSCKRLVSNCVSDKNVFSIESLIKQWIVYCHDEISLLETLELIITFGFSDCEYHTQFNPVIETILLKVQYLTAKKDDSFDVEDPLILYKKVGKILQKFDSPELIGFYQSIWAPQLERLQKFANQELLNKNAEAEKYWDILIREEQENNAREQKKIETIINRKLSTIASEQSEQNNHNTEDFDGSDSKDSASVNNYQPFGSDRGDDHRDISSSNTTYDSVEMAWRYYAKGQESQTDAILSELINSPLSDSLLIVQAKSLRAEMLTKRFFDVVKQGMPRSQAITACTTDYLAKMESNLTKQKQLAMLDKNERITIQKQQIRNVSDKIFELAKSFSTHQDILQEAFALQKEIIDTLQLFTVDSDQETQDLSPIKDDLELIIKQQARISRFVTNIKTASENLLSLLECRRQLLALIRKVAVKKSISDQSSLPDSGYDTSINRLSDMKTNRDSTPEEEALTANPITDIRNKMKSLVKTIESFRVHLLSQQQLNIAQRLICRC